MIARIVTKLHRRLKEIPHRLLPQRGKYADPLDPPLL